MKTFEELTPEEQTPLLDHVAESLGDLYHCTRVWGAWGYGTMTQDDFIEVSYDDELVSIIAEDMYNFMYKGEIK